MPDPQVRIFPDRTALSQSAAEQLGQVAAEAVSQRGRIFLALSGGGTPQELYDLLSKAPFREQFPWEHMYFFWGDERCVPPDDPESNYGQVKRILFDQVPVPTENIHRIHGEMDPAGAAQQYKAELLQFADHDLTWPRFDYVLLGMGADGHTASLFPGPIAPESQMLPVIPITASYQGRPASRVTLTPMVFNSARNVVFLVTGEEKAEALAGVLTGPFDPVHWPAQRIQPCSGSVFWLVDEAAAKGLPDRFRRK